MHLSLRDSQQHLSPYSLDVLLVSFIPDLLVGFQRPFPGTTPLAVGTLMLMHVATAMICLSMLSRLGHTYS